MSEELTLVCPIRGRLKAKSRSADGLLPSEEKLRIDAIRYLINHGYPKENIKIEAVIKRFGNSGRNSFRADLAVLDTPIKNINSGDVEQLLQHAIVLGEVKRDNNDYHQAKNTQVEPMLDFATRDDCVGLYWDDVEQRVFWQERVDGKRDRREGSLALLPSFGHKIKVQPLKFTDITPSDSLLDVFGRIENILHGASIDPEERYNVILQLLLTKLFDEHAHESKPNDPLEIQDFQALGVSPNLALSQFNELLEKAAKYYGRYLPRPVNSTLSVTSDTLIEIMQILAPIKIIASKHSVIQAFYMYFAKHLYRWDLAQYFTPTTVTDFIVNILNPRFGEHIKDPACGSADFLTAAFRLGRQFDPNYAQCVWGSDNSTNAVQVAVLNMLLNGDGKSNIKEEDSLENIKAYGNSYDILVCNPPFGTKIVEHRRSVLLGYELGYEWKQDEGGIYQKTNKLLPAQEAGLLFVEACVKQTRNKGRIGIILPNGYLGNRSSKYIAFREWLLRNCRVASICSFPRFTFKTSGADVSASVIYLEKRTKPLNKVSDDSDYEFNIEMIESVGWDVGNKRAEPIYKRNSEDGSFLVNESGELIIDSDFDSAIHDMRNSNAIKYFPWLAEGHEADQSTNGWSVPFENVLNEPTLCLDPKRYCRKVVELRKQIETMQHFTLGDVIEFVSERTTTDNNRIKAEEGEIYRYVEIQDIGTGDFSWVDLRGWELPDRARHFAEPNDIYIGSIWGSVSKWFLAGENSNNLVVTNGCHRMRIKKGKEDFLVDVIAGLCSEAYSTQMRSLARGSDGLAEVTESDTKSVLLPKITDEKIRRELEEYIEQLRKGYTTIKAIVSDSIKSGRLDIPIPNKRPSHSVLV